MKIFIVDDDDMMTEALSDYLGRKSTDDIQVFSTGEECIEHLAEKPDIIVLDFYLNSVNANAADGMEILKLIRKSNPDTHVIMLSSQEHYGIALKTVIQGAEQYVIKDEKSFAKVAALVEDYR